MRFPVPVGSRVLSVIPGGDPRIALGLFFEIDVVSWLDV
jgi:hypothetical protein